MINEPKKKPVAMSKSQLAELYDVSLETLRAWINRFPDDIKISKTAKLLTPEQVKMIYEKIGEP